MSPRKKKINLNWLETIEAAHLEAAKTGKTVLAYFTGSDWCQYCIGLYEWGMNTPEFAAFAEKYLILALLDFPRKVELTPERKQYCQDQFTSFKLTGLPTVLLLDKENNIIGRSGYEDGCSGPNFVKDLAKILKIEIENHE